MHDLLAQSATCVAEESERVMSGCGKLTKGSHPKDDVLPCGTKLWLGEKGRTEDVLLCVQCKKMIAS